MKVRLSKDYPAQTVAHTGERCEPGEIVEVTADVGRSLCEQAGKWSEARAPKGKATEKESDKS